ncbi:MAG: NAD(P)H-dependent oxidoreductase [Syntrophaceae bacterium]|nr:NAD(P)H-dependent oxidoreductase [Syntrophaceae bacterium]
MKEEVQSVDIVVLNGSPKGEQSVTLQYVRYLEKKFPQHQFFYFHIAEKIGKIEKDPTLFQKIIDAVKAADSVIWSFPLFYFLVPAQYKQFIELIWERHVEEAFHGKYTAVLTTSIHINDMMAHNYMNAICDDLNMHYLGFHSASMYDLLRVKEREQVLHFAENVFTEIDKEAPSAKNYSPLAYSPMPYHPARAQEKIDVGRTKIVLVTDAESVQSNLKHMTERFVNACSGNVDLINLHNVAIKGGCLECLQCAYDNTCVYSGKDGYIDFFNSKIRNADILVFAGAIRDRYLSSTWKLFFDRSFFNNHVPTLTNKQIGFIISGPLRQLPNLRQILESYAEAQQGNLGGLVTDEYENSEEIDTLIQDMAERLIRYAAQGYMKPRTYLSVGVGKIIRDDLWSSMRFPFLADHKYFKKHGLYDFPHKKYKKRLQNYLMLLLTKIPRIRRDIYTKNMMAETVKPLQKVVDEA